MSNFLALISQTHQSRHELCLQRRSSTDIFIFFIEGTSTSEYFYQDNCYCEHQILSGSPQVNTFSYIALSHLKFLWMIQKISNRWLGEVCAVGSEE